MRRLASLFALIAMFNAPRSGADAPPSQPRPDTTKVVLILGAPGEPEFGSAFADQAARLQDVCVKAGCEWVMIGAAPSNAPKTEQDGDAVEPAQPGEAVKSSDIEPTATPSETDRDRLQKLLEAEPKDGHAELWLILTGHGTFDGKEARFNLQGPDFSASELATWLAPFKRPVAVINTASASAPFLPKLAATNRVVITATRSGHEQNFTRFGEFFAAAITAPETDLDQDQQTSLLEAFLSASHRVAEFYKSEGRLATEHALIDDNGDGLGTPPDWFRGLRAIKRAKDNAPLDGLRAHQFHLVRSAAELALDPEVRARRDQLERELAHLRDSRDPADDAGYYRKLEPLLLELARLYQSIATP